MSFPVLRRVFAAHVDVRVGRVLLELEPALAVDEIARRGREASVLLRAEHPDVALVVVRGFWLVVFAALAARLPRILDVGASPLHRVPVVVRGVPLVTLGAHLLRVILVLHRPLLVLLEQPVNLFLAAVFVPHGAERLLGSLPRVSRLYQTLHVLLQWHVRPLDDGIRAGHRTEREDRRQRHRRSHWNTDDVSSTWHR